MYNRLVKHQPLGVVRPSFEFTGAVPCLVVHVSRGKGCHISISNKRILYGAFTIHFNCTRQGRRLAFV